MNKELELLIKAYEIIELEEFSHSDGLYQGKRDRALYIITKLIIDNILEEND